MMLQLRHRDVDLKLQGKTAPSEPPAQADEHPEGEASASAAEAREEPLQRAAASLEQFTTWHCSRGGAMSKKQAVAGLAAMQGQLQSERAKRAALEGRLRKDRERLSGLFDLAERQREEIRFLRQRLHEQLVESQHWGPLKSDWSRTLSTASKGSSLTRHASAPTTLPRVA
eukprot:SRR837773.6316.p2 GENE.SRR837773.6316~~SRR837773.6316.p2  ORF type:complete len:171 (-),score=32.57 SRR837773.6316:50-562(-)